MLKTNTISASKTRRRVNQVGGISRSPNARDSRPAAPRGIVEAAAGLIAARTSDEVNAIPRRGCCGQSFSALEWVSQKQGQSKWELETIDTVLILFHRNPTIDDTRLCLTLRMWHCSYDRAYHSGALINPIRPRWREKAQVVVDPFVRLC